MTEPKHTRGGRPDLDRIAADLDHIRRLGTLGGGRRDSLRRAATILRSATQSGDLLTLCPHALHTLSGDKESR